MNKKKLTNLLLFTLIAYLAIGFLFALYAWSLELKTFTCSASNEPHHTIGWGGKWSNPDPERCSRRGFELSIIASLPHLTVGWPIFLGGKIMKTYQSTP